MEPAVVSFRLREDGVWEGGSGGTCVRVCDGGMGRDLFLVFGVRWTIFGARLLACLLAVWPGLLFKRRGPPSPV